MIAYEDCGVKMTVLYHAKDLEGSIYPQVGDKVRLCTRQSVTRLDNCIGPLSKNRHKSMCLQNS